jgi:hypothetical protein
VCTEIKEVQIEETPTEEIGDNSGSPITTMVVYNKHTNLKVDSFALNFYYLFLKLNANHTLSRLPSMLAYKQSSPFELNATKACPQTLFSRIKWLDDAMNVKAAKIEELLKLLPKTNEPLSISKLDFSAIKFENARDYKEPVMYSMVSIDLIEGLK